MQDIRIVSRYFQEQIRRGFYSAFNKQRSVAHGKIYSKQAYYSNESKRSRSGNLQQALESPDFKARGAGDGVEAVYSYPTYMRFLDMKRKANYRLYNRPLWRTFYKETIPAIRFEFTDWLAKNFKQDIQQATK